MMKKNNLLPTQPLWSKLAFASFGLYLLVDAPSHAKEDLKPIDQFELNRLSVDQSAKAAFEFAFEAGDELTEFSFTAEKGVGANIGEGRRFTRFPRADLDNLREWANHFPKREGGANATSCIACHNSPIANGAGDVALNAIVDPAHTGDPSLYLERNTLHLLGLGIPQRLAEEMSETLFAQKAKGVELACKHGDTDVTLEAKKVKFGVLKIVRKQQQPCLVDFNYDGVEGIDDDLVVKAFGWKGNHATIRSFTRGAAHNELGLQAVELVGDKDGDYDGVTSELSVGDMSALSIYMAALERPVTKVELAELGLVELSSEQKSLIMSGEKQFEALQCSSCHIPQMEIKNSIFTEPSNVPGFFDELFPDGSNPRDHGLVHKTSLRFDLAKDQPNNKVEIAGNKTVHLGAVSTDEDGKVMATWFTDFKRHDMGDELADPSDPLGVGANMFLTRSLAGVGSTGPWLHDGRATTLEEAILAHGGEAEESAVAYKKLSAQEAESLTTYLENLVIFKIESEEHKE
jgi:mono/diheme cytochrome c family protein